MYFLRCEAAPLLLDYGVLRHVTELAGSAALLLALLDRARASG